MKNSRSHKFLDKTYPYLAIGFVVLIVFWDVLRPGTQFFIDWVNSYWLVLVARDNPQPQWVMGTVQGVTPLEPWQLYYGGTWYSLVGRTARIAQSFGFSAIAVFRRSFAALATTTALSIYGICRVVKLDKPTSLFLAIIGITNSYYLTNAVGRGAYTEFAAASLIAPMILTMLLHLTSQRTSIQVISGFVFTITFGLFLTTYNLSVLMFFLFCASIIAALVLAIRPIRLLRSFDKMRKSSRRILSVPSLITSSIVLVSPQFLTVVLTGQNTILGKPSWVPFTEFSSVNLTFSLFPRTSRSSTTPDLRTQTCSLLFFVTVLVVIYLVKRRAIRPQFIYFSLLLLVFGVVVTSSSYFWMHAPDFLQTIQYTYRYVTYLTLSILIVSGLMFLNLQRLLNSAREPRKLLFFKSGLALVALASILSAVWQVNHAVLRTDQVDLATLRSDELPATWYAPFGFRRVGGTSAPESQIQNIASDSRRVTFEVKCAEGETTRVPIASSPLLQGEGAKIVGSSPEGLVVIKMEKCSDTDWTQVTLTSGPATQSYRFLRVASLMTYSILMILMVVIKREKSFRNFSKNRC